MRSVLAVGFLSLAAAALLAEKPGQHAKPAYGAGRPFKLNAEPLKQGAEAGSRLPVRITILDVYNNPTPLAGDVVVKASITGPRGGTDGETEKIKGGQSSVVIYVEPEEAGLNRLTVEDKDRFLRGGNANILVTPKRPATARPSRAPASKPIGFYSPGARFVLARFSPGDTSFDDEPDPIEPSRPSAPRARLVMAVSGGDGAGDGSVLADGIDAAKIDVFYMAEDGSVPSTDIEVWLKATKGTLSPSNPLKIRAGSPFTQATLTAKQDVKSLVSIALSNPALSFDPEDKQEVNFVPPIFEIGLSGTERMSIVQVGYLQAQFRGIDGKVVAPAAARRITFSSSGQVSPHPREGEIKAGQPGTFIDLVPITVGRAIVQASTHGYQPTKFTVEVTVLTVLLFCILGGVLGSIVALSRSRGKTIRWKIYTTRVLAGELAAIVATWAYVFGALPNLNSAVLHNDISVLPVSLLAGYAGTAVLDTVASKIFGTPQPG